jgi:site-specific DNA recombinase
LSRARNRKPSEKRRRGKAVRCAVYTRKSTEEGLDSDFNSLDAQREAGEAYVRSQRSEGWMCLPDRFDDGGYSGGDLERPALQRLLGDVKAGKIDCVVVYKVDRLSRSLMDFARIIDAFDDHGVSFVSVTQQFNTGTSMGRLSLNVLLSFAQFEREIISERTRDKMAAARRRGKWTGGQPPLGYDIDREAKRLVVNDEEARLVIEVFELYAKRQSIIEVVRELDRRGIRTKSWTTKKGKRHGGNRFDKAHIRRLLSNVTYVGKVRHDGEIYAGEHEPIVDEDLFYRVQDLLDRNRRRPRTVARNKHDALLKGLLRCGSCDAAMTHYVVKKGNRRYRYYVCTRAQKRGWDSCPTKQIPAQEIEDFVVERLREIGRDAGLVRDSLREKARAGASRKRELEKEQRALESGANDLHGQAAEIVERLAQGKISRARAADRQVDLQEEIRKIERRATEVREELIAIDHSSFSQGELKAALRHFGPGWEVLFAGERARILRLLLERVDWDREAETLVITFSPTGVKAVAAEAGAGSEGQEG